MIGSNGKQIFSLVRSPLISFFKIIDCELFDNTLNQILTAYKQFVTGQPIWPMKVIKEISDPFRFSHTMNAGQSISPF